MNGLINYSIESLSNVALEVQIKWRLSTWFFSIMTWAKWLCLNVVNWDTVQIMRLIIKKHSLNTANFIELRKKIGKTVSTAKQLYAYDAVYLSRSIWTNDGNINKFLPKIHTINKHWTVDEIQSIAIMKRFSTIGWSMRRSKRRLLFLLRCKPIVMLPSAILNRAK